MCEKHNTRRPDLAELIAETFAHPELPKVLWEYMADAICELDGSFDKYENPAVMREVLRLHKVREAREKGGAC